MPLVESGLDFPIDVFAQVGFRTAKDDGARRAGDEVIPDALDDIIGIVAVNFTVERVVENQVHFIVESLRQRVVVDLVARMVVADENAATDGHTGALPKGTEE